MKPVTLQQEILLVASTTLSKRLLCRADASGPDYPTDLERLEEGGWNGLLTDLIPEIIERPASGYKFFFRETHQGNAFLQIVLSEFRYQLKTNFQLTLTVLYRLYGITKTYE